MPRGPAARPRPASASGFTSPATCATRALAPGRRKTTTMAAEVALPAPSTPVARGVLRTVVAGAAVAVA